MLVLDVQIGLMHLCLPDTEAKEGPGMQPPAMGMSAINNNTQGIPLVCCSLPCPGSATCNVADVATGGVAGSKYVSISNSNLTMVVTAKCKAA